MVKETNIYNGVKMVCSINGVRKIRQIHAKNDTGTPFFPPHTKKYSG